jgi:hypothetical protein
MIEVEAVEPLVRKRWRVEVRDAYNNLINVKG